jgi:hypothetical protein
LTGGTCAILLLTIGSLVVTARGSYALWNQAVGIPEAIVTTGTLSATIAIGADRGATAPVPAESFSGMLPGETRSVSLTVENTGTTPLSVAASMDDAAASDEDVSFGLASGACSPSPALGTPLTAVPSNVGGRLLPGESAPFCLIANLSTTVPNITQGMVLIPAFTLLLSAQQEPA